MFAPGCLSQSITDDVAFLNAPDAPVSLWLARVLYTCAESSVVHVQVLVSFDTGSTAILFDKYWTCEPGRTRSRVVTVRFPDWLVYRPDWIIRGSDWVLSCLLRAWIGSDDSPEPDRFSLASVAVHLDVQPPLSRPVKNHLICASWGAALLRRVDGDDAPQCAKENGKKKKCLKVFTHTFSFYHLKFHQLTMFHSIGLSHKHLNLSLSLSKRWPVFFPHCMHLLGRIMGSSKPSNHSITNCWKD